MTDHQIRYCLRTILPLSMMSLVAIFISYKALTMQVTCDEAYTVQILAHEPLWDLVSYKSAYTNNHLLNTLCVKALFLVFGKNHVLARLPCWLAMWAYFYFCGQLSRRFIQNDWVSALFWAVMCLNPYLIDFFGLTRGYGLSIGLMMGSVYFAARFIVEGHQKSLVPSLLLAVLAVYAQFATLHFYLGINLTIGLFLCQQWRQAGDRAVFLRHFGKQLGAAFALAMLIVLPIRAILKYHQIAYYGKNGFWQDTITSLLRGSLYGQNYFSDRTNLFFQGLIALVLLSVAIKIGRSLWHQTLLNDERAYPSVFFATVFATTALSAIAQFHWLHNEYVIDRTALFFYPLLAALFPVVPCLFVRSRRWVLPSVVGLILLFTTYHFLRSARTNVYHEWWYDTYAYEVLAILAQQPRQPANKKITLGTTWMFQPSMWYHGEKQAAAWLQPVPFLPKVDTVQTYDFYYATSDDYKFLNTRYDTVKTWNNGGLVLARRKP